MIVYASGSPVHDARDRCRRAAKSVGSSDVTVSPSPRWNDPDDRDVGRQAGDVLRAASSR
jgi:hypothetical protein